MKLLPLAPHVVAWVDDIDFERFGHLKWRLDDCGRVTRDGGVLVGRQGVVLLPRLILGAWSWQEVRHLNRVKVDCRRENLVVEDGKKPGRLAAEEDLSVCVLRFLEAFPKEKEFKLSTTRGLLRDARERTGITKEEFLARINAWATARANIAPWDLEKPAPLLQKCAAEPTPHVPTIILPEPSAGQRAWTSAMLRAWTTDGTA